MKRMDPRGSAHLSSVYAASLTSRQRVNKQSVRERHMLEPWFVYTNSSVCRWSESGSRHRLLFSAAPDPLLAADNFFLLFPPRRLDCLFVSTLYHFPLCRLFIISLLLAASSTLPSVNNSKISLTSPLHIHQFLLR